MGILEVRNLTKLFGGLKAVSDYSLNLNKGELIGIIGPNGAGKTTIFNLLTGVYPPTSGEILLEGKSIIGLRPDQIVQRGISRTFQNIRLFKELSVIQNVKIAHHLHTKYTFWDTILSTPSFLREEEELERQALEYLKIFDMDKDKDKIASSLPYGNQRKLEIARALASNPKILLLDEPAAGMNPNEVTELVKLIKMIRERFDLTIILIEHQMSLVMNICERIQVLDSGELIAEGIPEEIQSNQRVIEAYLGKRVGRNA